MAAGLNVKPILMSLMRLMSGCMHGNCLQSRSLSVRSR